MAGLVPAIHVIGGRENRTWMPGTSSAKTRFALLPGHDGGATRSPALQLRLVALVDHGLAFAFAETGLVMNDLTDAGHDGTLDPIRRPQF
jgi:hypothetical protein